MTMQARPGVRNRLLSMLAPDDFEAIRPLLEPVTLRADQVLETPDEEVGFAYFPESGIASVIATHGIKHRVEAGPFGREGMSGLPLLLSADRSPHETRVQAPGAAHRIKAEDLRHMIAARSDIHAVLLRYVQAFSIQTAHTLISAAQAKVELRLARWILMLHDRVDGHEMSITHEYMALMLSVRRTGVTVALHVLEGNGLIRSTRGRLQVRDRVGLERMCGSFYGGPEAEYARLLGPEHPKALRVAAGAAASAV